MDIRLLCPASPVPTEKKPRRAEETARTIHLLLVEDSQEEVRQLQEFLQEVVLPITLHAVDRRTVALTFLRHTEPYAQTPCPQVIVLDLELPQRDGGRLLEEIANDAAQRAIPVVTFNRTNDQHVHLVAAVLVAAYLTHSLEREQYLKLLEKLPWRR